MLVTSRISGALEAGSAALGRASTRTVLLGKMNKGVSMGRFFMGSISAFSTQKRSFTVTSAFNPSGDWGNTYALAHPMNPGAELVCDFHSKLLSPFTGTFIYSITVRNSSPVNTFFAIDF
jgi:hypothetical protein